MKHKLTRRDLKRNELVATMGRTVDYVQHHRGGVTKTIAAAVGVVVVAGGFVLWRAWRERDAGRHLSLGLAALETPLVGEPAAKQAAKTYPDAAARQRDAETHWKKAADRSGTVAGRAASLLLAARESRAEGAAAFTKMARSKRGEIAGAAELDAARVLAGAGRTTEAIDRLKHAIESSDVTAPKDALLFALAEIYEKSGAGADARAVYQRLVNDYPESPYRSDARAKLLPGS
jgi:tetratricopeptide (TPR) repeat protein